MGNILRLKEVLEDKNISGKELAKQVDVSTTTISNIATGNQYPKPELLLKIAKTLDVDIRELFISTKNCLSSSEINSVVFHLEEAIKALKGK